MMPTSLPPQATHRVHVEASRVAQRRVVTIAVPVATSCAKEVTAWPFLNVFGTRARHPPFSPILHGQVGLREGQMRIGEAAAAASMTTKALRFYEVEGLLPYPERAPNGYRDYGEETVGRLQFIRRGRAAGLNLAQIREILRLRDAGTAPCRHVVTLLGNELERLDAQIAELTALRATVASFHEAANAGDPTRCDAELICSYV